MFGFSFGELLVISLVALVAVGPQKLPGVLKTMGHWARKLRKMTTDVRQQTGIDEMLRAEGIQLSELRSLMRDYHPASIAASLSAAATAPPKAPTPSASHVSVQASAPASVSGSISSDLSADDPYFGLEPDPTREYPPEGADSYGALPDDLLEPPTDTAVAAAPGAPEPEPAPPPAPAPPLNVETANASPGLVAAPVEPSVAPAPTPPEPSVTPAPAPMAPLRPVAPAVKPSSAPPPPPVRPSAPRAASVPPPPPRRSAPPRPEPNGSATSVSSVTPAADAPRPGALPSSPGTANGNG